jgi:hypothetical protein
MPSKVWFWIGGRIFVRLSAVARSQRALQVACGWDAMPFNIEVAFMVNPSLPPREPVPAKKENVTI